MTADIQVLRHYHRQRCIHRYNPATDGPVCNSRIKREDWELLTMDFVEWKTAEWHCWACPWTLEMEGTDDT
jgi:hypothetical protein